MHRGRALPRLLRFGKTFSGYKGKCISDEQIKGTVPEI